MMSDTSVLDRVLADLELEAGPDRNAKAVKDDKAKAPTYMWDKWTLPLCALANPNAPGATWLMARLLEALMNYFAVSKGDTDVASGRLRRYSVGS